MGYGLIDHCVPLTQKYYLIDAFNKYNVSYNYIKFPKSNHGMYNDLLGEVLNLFDLVVINLIWWRNTKRIRFKDILEKEMYQNPKQHIDSFFRGMIMYLLVAIIDGIILTIL